MVFFHIIFNSFTRNYHHFLNLQKISSWKKFISIIIIFNILPITSNVCIVKLIDHFNSAEEESNGWGWFTSVSIMFLYVTPDCKHCISNIPWWINLYLVWCVLMSTKTIFYDEKDVAVCRTISWSLLEHEVSYCYFQ